MSEGFKNKPFTEQAKLKIFLQKADEICDLT